MTLNKEQTAEILESFGYEIDRNFKFKIRDEKTASASINPKNGKIKDFGSGWVGDIVDFLVEFENFSKKEAFAKVNEILKNKTYEKSVKFRKNILSHLKESNSENLTISQDLIDKFLNERKENFSRFWELLSQTMPTISKETKREFAKIYEIGYSKKADRLIMPIRDEKNECVTLWKYNPNPTPFFNENSKLTRLPKVIFSKNHHRTIFSVKNLINFSKSDKPLFIFEGEKDCLNALASGFEAITLGSASANIESKFLEYFKNKYVVIAYDFDEAGRNGALNLKNELENLAFKVEIIEWKNIAKKLNFELKKGFDFSDFLKATNQNEIKNLIEK